MAKAPGGYVPLNMNYMRDKDIRRAGADAEHLYIRSLAHAKAGMTDGLIGDFDLEVVAVGMKLVAKRVAALVKVGLWIEVEGGWEIRNWSKWNMTGEEIRTDKTRKRDAAISTNHTRWHVEKGEKDPNCRLCHPDDASLQRSVERVATPIKTPIASEVKRSEEKSESSQSEVSVTASVAIATPSESHTSPPAGTDVPNSSTLIAEWIDHCDQRPPSRVIGQISKEVKTMLDEGIEYERVRSGLVEWNRKGLHPSTLASVVHEVANKKPASKLATTDQRVADGLALAQRLHEREQTDNQPHLRAIGQHP